MVGIRISRAIGGTVWRFLKKLKIVLPYILSSHSYFWCISKDNEMSIQRDTSAFLFMEHYSQKLRYGVK
jgi:hypothetical protein